MWLLSYSEMWRPRSHTCMPKCRVSQPTRTKERKGGRKTKEIGWDEEKKKRRDNAENKTEQTLNVKERGLKRPKQKLSKRFYTIEED